MDEFSKIEDNFKRTPVQLVGHEQASGVLRLRGRKSRLDISSGSPLHFQSADDNGWYDLRVRASDGREVLLHHCVTEGSGTHHWGTSGDDAHTLSAFPNIVVDDTRGLTDDLQLQCIRFRLSGLHRFFRYQNTEKLRVYEATAEQIEVLRSMRYATTRENGPFDPLEVHIVHQFPELVAFRVADRAYSVWSGGRFSGGRWDRIDATTFPVAEIAFDQPVTIETALDRVWEWRRFFSQMAMTQLPLEAISVQATADEGARSANIYLPNLGRKASPREGRRPLSARHIAYNSWTEREQLGEGMRRWLDQDAGRRLFRVRLDRVIGRMHRRIDPSDLIELGSAADSLDELALATAFPDGAIDAMVAAAHAAAEVAGADVPRDRLQGLLGSLQRPSLANRFRGLGAELSPAPSADDMRLLVRSASRIRNSAAHGGAMDDQIQPRIAPTIEALAALCARFDLESCGFPSLSAAHSASTMAKLQFDDGIAELRMLEADAANVERAL